MWCAASDSWYSTSQAARLEQLAGAAGEADLHDRVAAAVGDEHARVLPAREVGLPPLDDRDEAREGEDPGRRRAVGARDRASSSSPSPSRSPRARSAPAPSPVRSHSSSWKPASSRVGRVEGVVVGIADARHDVPVVARASPAASAAPAAWRRAAAAAGRARRRGRAGRARRRRGRGAGRAGRRGRRPPGARGRSARSWPRTLSVGERRPWSGPAAAWASWERVAVLACGRDQRGGARRRRDRARRLPRDGQRAASTSARWSCWRPASPSSWPSTSC